MGRGDALKKQSQEKILYNKDLQLGKILLDKKYLTLDELTEALSLSIEDEIKQEKVMPIEIGEGSKFTFDLKFLVTIVMIVVSGCGIYFSMNSAIGELKSANSPSRLEYDVLQSEITGIKNAGNLDIITYKLEEYDETFAEIKGLVNDLKPLKADLDYIKKELDNLKNVEPIKIPEVDLSGLEESINKLSVSIESMENKTNIRHQR